MSAARWRPKTNSQLKTQNALPCPGRNRTARSRAESQDNRMQMGVFRGKMEKPMGRTNRASICPSCIGRTQAAPHRAATADCDRPPAAGWPDIKGVGVHAAQAQQAGSFGEQRIGLQGGHRGA